MLPIESVIPELRAALAASRAVVLEAPPGAGKTTRVPLALLDAEWLAGQRIVMLEPRRLAARAAAARMASTLGERVGGRVGHRVRGDTVVGRDTRIEVVTEGVLTRMLQRDAGLDGIGLVIFDEFHERSLTADTGLALTLATAEVLRPDLRVLVMSATLNGLAVAALLGGAPVVRSTGRSFSVEIRHRPPPAGAYAPEHAASLVRDALATESGSILVFLAGAGEIRRAHEALRSVPRDVTVHQLFGAMSPDAQDRAIAPAPHGRRKVVLATNVAESSLTIEGISIVIDSGWMRIPRYSPRTGMTRLDTIRVSRASADQRCGRAGRTMPGICIRAWSASEDSSLISHGRSEIVDADLMPLALDLAAAGFPDPDGLRWLDPPPAAAFSEARALLTLLGAFGHDGRLTAHGAAMAELGTHPRLAHMMLRARDDSAASAARAASIAALLDERDLMRGEGGAPPVDLTLRLDAIERTSDSHGDSARFDPVLLQRVRTAAAAWRRRLGVSNTPTRDAEDAGTLLALAYPDRVAQRRGTAGRFLLRNGRGASVPVHDPMSQAPWLVAAALDDSGADARVQLAAAFDPAALEHLAAEQVTDVIDIAWDEASGGVRARRRTMLGALVLSEAAVHRPDPTHVREAFLDGLRRVGIDALPWSERAARVRQRMRFVAWHADGWPSVEGSDLLASVETWLGPHLGGARRLDDLVDVDLGAALLTMLDWDQRRQLDTLAPELFTVPSGSQITIDYGDPDAPSLAVRLQEVFGMRQTPRVGGGAVPVVLHLLSPGYRPAQVTRDLESFWATGYYDVRKELRSRYPKHSWPDDPLGAVPVRGPRRRT